jgi:hypothetical protein
VLQALNIIIAIIYNLKLFPSLLHHYYKIRNFHIIPLFEVGPQSKSSQEMHRDNETKNHR